MLFIEDRKIVFKYKNTINFEAQKYAQGALVSFNTGSVVYVTKATEFKYMSVPDMVETDFGKPEAATTATGAATSPDAANGSSTAPADGSSTAPVRILAATTKAYSPGMKIQYLSSVTISFLKPATLDVFQLTKLTEERTYGAGDAITHAKGTKLKFRTPARLQFLQDTEATLKLAYRPSPERITPAETTEIYFLTGTILDLESPEKVSVLYLDDTEVQVVTPNTFMISQKTDKGTTAYIIPCNSTCKDCFGPTKNDCNACWTNFYLQGGTCMCPILGFVYSSIF